MNLEITVS